MAPFISLSELENQYVVVMEAPGLCASNIEINLHGRELHLSTAPVSTRTDGSGSVTQSFITVYRVRIPGPISETGPPRPEFAPGGRLRVTFRKAAEATDPGLKALTVL